MEQCRVPGVVTWHIYAHPSRDSDNAMCIPNCLRTARAQAKYIFSKVQQAAPQLHYPGLRPTNYVIAPESMVGNDPSKRPQTASEYTLLFVVMFVVYFSQICKQIDALPHPIPTSTRCWPPCPLPTQPQLDWTLLSAVSNRNKSIQCIFHGVSEVGMSRAWRTFEWVLTASLSLSRNPEITKIMSYHVMVLKLSTMSRNQSK